MRIQRILDSVVAPAVSWASHKVTRDATRPWVRGRLEGHCRLHLACGNNVLDGWANIDLKSKESVIGWDLTGGLPVRSDTIELIFCEHFIEHVTLKQATQLLAETHRVLKPRGTLRLSTPSLQKVFDEYTLGRTQEWSDVGWSPATPCQMVNGAFRLWGHQFVYDSEELTRILAEAGYSTVTQVAWRESTNPALRKLECRPFHGEIIIEASK